MKLRMQQIPKLVLKIFFLPSVVPIVMITSRNLNLIHGKVAMSIYWKRACSKISITSELSNYGKNFFYSPWTKFSIVSLTQHKANMLGLGKMKQKMLTSLKVTSQKSWLAGKSCWICSKVLPANLVAPKMFLH